MQPEIAVIRSSEKEYCYNTRLLGLYPLERNIRILLKSGISMIYLDLDEKENDFYLDKIVRNLDFPEKPAMLGNARISPKKTVLVIPSNLFMQSNALDSIDANFHRKKNQLLPVIKEDQFLVHDRIDIKRAEVLISGTFPSGSSTRTAGGIHRRLSSPISRKMAETGCSNAVPSVSAVIMGLAASLFMFMITDRSMESAYRYLVMAMAGLFFLSASVLHQVAEDLTAFTLKDSGNYGRLYSIADSAMLVLFIIASSYLSCSSLGGTVFLISMGIIAISVTAIFLARRRREQFSSDAVPADIFMNPVAGDGLLVRFIKGVQCMMERQHYSLAVFLITIAGLGEILLPLASIIVLGNSILAGVVYARHAGKTAG